MNLSIFLFLACGLIMFGSCGKSNADLDHGNKQVLADSFRDLVRYVMLKTFRDVEKFGVTPDKFTVEAMDKSLAAPANAGISGERGVLSMKRLLEKALKESLTFRFYWKAPVSPEPLEAAFDLSYKDENLKVRLLWLGLPERVPISPSAGVIEGRKPFEEAVMQLLRFRKGRLAPYPPPQ